MSPSAVERAAASCEVLGGGEAVAAEDHVELHGHDSFGRWGGTQPKLRRAAPPAIRGIAVLRRPACRISPTGRPAPRLESPDGRASSSDASAGARAPRARCSSARATGAARSCCVSGEAGVGKTRLTAELARGAGRARAARRRGAGPHARPTARSSRRCARTCARTPAGSTTSARCAATSRCCCPSSASRPARPTARRCSRRCARARGDRAAAPRRVSCSTTCSGPTRRRSRCWPRSPSRCTSCRCWWSPPTAPTACRATTAVRRLRHDLRRAGRLEELVLRAARARRRPPSCCARVLGARARRRRSCARSTTAPRALPFFVEELAAALRVSGALTRGRRGLELAGDGEVPLPDTVRDAVLISTSRAVRRRRARRPRSRPSRARRFDLALVAALVERRRRHRAARARAGARAGAGTGRVPARAHARGALRRRPVDAPARAAPRARRGARARRRAAAARSPRTGSARTTASARARRCCARPPSPRPCTPTATPPSAGRQALELWPDDGDDDAPRRRARALRALLPARRRAGRGRRAPGASSPPCAPARARGRDAQRRLAAVLELQGRPRGGRRARATPPPSAFAADGPPGRGRGRAHRDRQPAAPRRPATARRSSSRSAAKRDAERAGRLDLRIRALGIEGMARAKHGEYARGPGDRPPRPRARARARPHRGRRRALPAPERDALRVGRLPRAPRRRSTPRWSCAGRARTPDTLGACVSLHGLRPARARRVVARDARCAAR